MHQQRTRRRKRKTDFTKNYRNAYIEFLIMNAQKLVTNSEINYLTLDAKLIELLATCEKIYYAIIKLLLSLIFKFSFSPIIRKKVLGCRKHLPFEKLIYVFEIPQVNRNRYPASNLP